MILLNTGDSTHLGREPSCIDLSFGSAYVGMNSFWQVSRESFGSDHCVIEIKMFTRPCNKTTPAKFVPKKIDKSTLNDKLIKLLDSPEFMKESDSFFNELSDKYTNAIGVKPKKGRRRIQTLGGMLNAIG